MCTNFFREWAPRRLHALAAKLNEVCYLVGDGFKLPPSDGDFEFWCTCATLVNSGTHMCAPLLDIDSVDLCNAVHQDLESIDMTEVVSGKLFLGEMGACESTLAFAMLGIRSVVVITDSDFTWHAISTTTGVPTHPLTPAGDLKGQLASLGAFARSTSDGACYVCSTSGNGLAAAACAAVLATLDCSRMSAAMALELVERRRGLLRLDEDQRQALTSFFDRKVPPPPPRPLAASEEQAGVLSAAQAAAAALEFLVTTPKKSVNSVSSSLTRDRPSASDGFRLNDPVSPVAKTSKERMEANSFADTKSATSFGVAARPLEPSKPVEPKPTEHQEWAPKPPHNSRCQDVGCGDTNF